MSDIVERLRALVIMDEVRSDNPLGREAADEIERLRDRTDDLAEALQKIVQWSEAYPLDIFPEPDFKKAHEVLKAIVGQIARAALGTKRRPRDDGTVVAVGGEPGASAGKSE